MQTASIFVTGKLAVPAWLKTASYISDAASWATKVGTYLELTGLLLEGKLKQLGKVVGLGFVGAIASVIEDAFINGLIKGLVKGDFSEVWKGLKEGFGELKAIFGRGWKDFFIPVYGLWCGPGYGISQRGMGDDDNPTPSGVDGYDAKCKIHDQDLRDRQRNKDLGRPYRTKTHYDWKLIKGVVFSSTSKPRFVDMAFSGRRVGDIYGFTIPFAFGARIIKNRGK